MSEDDAEPELAVEEVEDGEQDDGDGPAADGQPDVSDGGADLSGLDLDGDDLDPDPGDDSEEDDSDQDDADDAPEDDPDASVGGGEWGDMYVSMVTQTTNSILDKHGDGHTVNEDHFREVDLDVHFNATLEKYSASGTDMPPEQALVVGTLVAVGAPVALHTDLPNRLRQEVSE